MKAPLPDDADRSRAASDFEVNLLVRAGAGTGKTELLVERILTALGSGRVEIGQLAALTFTEKAAGEMRERLALGLDRLRALARGERSGPAAGAALRTFERLTGVAGIPADEIATRALAALVALDRAHITTIHSFCSDLLRRHPREANVDPAFRVDPGEHFEAAFDEEWIQFLSHETGPVASAGGAWSRLMVDLGAGELRAIAMGLASFSFPQALLATSYEPQAVQVLMAEAVRQLIDRLARAEAATGLTATNSDYLAFAREALIRFEEAGVHGLEAYFVAAPERRDRILDSGTKLGKKVAGITVDEFEALVRDTRRLVRSLLSIHDELIGRVMAALTPFARKFREAYLARGLVSFDGLLHLARDLLAEHPGVRRAVRHTFRMIVVDEFQDTDPVQYELVLFLAEEEEGRAADAFDARLAPGRLFVVGDAKQSIYRFRGADYEAFRRAADRIVAEGGAHASLTTNFRSVPRVLAAVNRLMGPEGSAWRESPYLPAYEPVHPQRADGGPAVEVWTVSAGANSARARRCAEGKALAERIHTWVEAERACRYGEITVLFRSFTQLSLYLKPLRKAGIPFIVDGGRGFVERPEVGHLLGILRTLAAPSDPVALLTYLRSPAGGVPDTELAGHASAGGNWDWRAAVDTERFPALAAALGRLRDLDLATRDLPIDSRIRAALNATDLLVLSAASFDGAQRVANLRKLSRLASNLARDGKLSTGEILDALENEQVSQSEADSPLADDAADAVRILTIHKAKGLENRRVILVDVARENRDQRDTQRVRVARAGGVTRPAISAGLCMNAARAWLDEEERRHDQAEETRVLYVALTRARDHLSIFLGSARGNPQWLAAFKNWGYDPAAPPEDGATLDGGRVLHRRLVPRDVPMTVSRATADVDPAVANYRDALAALRGSRRGARKTPSGAAPPVAAEGSTEDRARARAAGTAVHELLRRWSIATDADLLTNVREVAESAAADASVAANMVAQDVEEIVAAFLRSELPARMRRARVLGREVPMILNDEGDFWSGSLDLLMEESGAVVVVDFKTDRESDAAALVKLYRPQLSVYSRAVQRALALPNPPRAELWLLRKGTAVPVL